MRLCGALLLFLLGMLVLSGCGNGGEGPAPGETVVVTRARIVESVSGRGTVFAESNVTVSPPKWWRLKITKLMVKEGDKVKKDDILMELDTENLEENVRDRTRDIAASQGALDSAEALLTSRTDRLEAEVKKFHQDSLNAETAYEELKVLPGKTDLANAGIDADTTVKMAEQAKVRYENMKRLYGKGGGVSLQQLEQRELEYRSADAERKRAELQLKLVESGAPIGALRDAELALKLAKLNMQQAVVTRDLTIEQLEESVNKAKARLKMNQGNLKRIERIREACIIRAPVAGTVFYGKVRTSEGTEKIKEGVEVRPWNRLIELPDTTQMQIKVEVDEKDIGAVKPGQQTQITLDAYRQRVFTGTVTRLEPVARYPEGREGRTKRDEREDLGAKIVEVVITFNEQDDMIRNGLRGQVQIRTETESEGLVVPIEAVFNKEGRTMVRLVVDGELVTTPVRTGARGRKNVLILSGLDNGDVVSLKKPTKEGAK